MVSYRRNRVAGGTYFFTVTLRNRSSDLLVRHVDLLRVAFRNVRTDRPFTIDAIVILPDHLHTIWTLPEDDTDYSGRWRAIKSCFTHSLRATGISFNRDNRGEYQLWQRRFWEHTIRDERDYAHHVDYCHWNPIKHGLVQHLSDWPHSSFHRYVRLGLLPPDWSGMIAEPKADYGELIM
ncbi:MAG: transposase [Methylococcales bacterium]